MAMAVAAAVRVILVSQAFGSPPVELNDQGERDWSFGQLLTMLLLILPFISALEIYRGMLLCTEKGLKHSNIDNQSQARQEFQKPRLLAMRTRSRYL